MPRYAPPYADATPCRLMLLRVYTPCCRHIDIVYMLCFLLAHDFYARLLLFATMLRFRYAITLRRRC